MNEQDNLILGLPQPRNVQRNRNLIVNLIAHKVRTTWQPSWRLSLVDNNTYIIATLSARAATWQGGQVPNLGCFSRVAHIFDYRGLVCDL